ncbi:MAG TPA: HD domain-containing phosphohydrolase [Gemmatimonadaceae bacterium]|nr:HD domain-containing phosphohydrolase [Gemmatimonadaceae bacterium]
MSASLPEASRAPTTPAVGGVVSALMEEARRAAASGRRALARQRYESALYLLRAPGEGILGATILRRIGRTFLDDGDFAAGLDCLTAALAIAEAHQDAGEIAHTVNVMAISHWQRGQLDDGERLHNEAGRIARIAGDERLIAMVEQNLGVIASMRGDVERALTHYTESLARYRALRLFDEVARLLSNIGMAYASLERWDEAEATYAESSTLARQCGDTWTRLMVDVNRAALLVARRKFDEAHAVCERVLREAGAVKETRLLAETYKHCGVIARETGQMDEAERHLRVAFDQATAREDLLLAAETAREQAELYLALGRNRDTLQALSLSHRLFTQLRAQRDLADVTRRLRGLESRFHVLVQQWAQSIESKDAYTLGHCERVADYACAIATDMGMDETTLFWFRVGALLHDVGKIVVPSDILNKAGPLTPEERSWMERHPTAGVELLRDVEFPWDVIPMIRNHHERWDGHGYPDQLAGDAIPLAARILCVADVYDALTSHRPYRRAYEPADAQRLMQGDMGRHFDPEILDRFFRLLPGLLEREAAAQSRTQALPVSRAYAYA